MAPHVRQLLCFLFLSAPIGVRARMAAATDAELQKGQEQYRAGDIAGALTTFRRIALSRPNDPNVLFSLAEALGQVVPESLIDTFVDQNAHLGAG